MAIMAILVNSQGCIFFSFFFFTISSLHCKGCSFIKISERFISSTLFCLEKIKPVRPAVGGESRCENVTVDPKRCLGQRSTRDDSNPSELMRLLGECSAIENELCQRKGGKGKG